MKLIILFLLICNSAFATNYYVSNSGSDAANGITTGTAWQTIAKVNSSSFLAGDSVLFKKGDSWNEKLKFPSSGVAGNPIIIGAYSTGNKPLITGFVPLTMVDQGGNIWAATATGSVDSLNCVLINGQIGLLARFPNSGYLTFTGSTNTSLTTSLSGTPDYTGSQIAVRSTTWIIDRVSVTSQSGGTLNITPVTYYTPAYGGSGFFFQNKLSYLDSLREFVINYSTKLLSVFATSQPTVQYSNKDTVLWLSQKSYLTFDGIKFTGANNRGVQIDTCNNITFQNCTSDNMGAFAICGLKSPHLSFLNDSITNSLSEGIYCRTLDPYNALINQCDSILIQDCYLKNTGFIAGMGKSGDNRYTAIFIHGLDPLMQYNVVDSSGYGGIQWYGKRFKANYNVVSNFCFIKNDGTGMGTGVGGFQAADANDFGEEKNNIIFNGLGALAMAGTSYAGFTGSEGLYLDDFSRYITLEGNTVFNTTDGIYLHNGSRNTVRNNTLFNNFENQFYVKQIPNQSLRDSFYITGNKIYSSLLNCYPFRFYTSIAQPSVDYFATTMDSNYYSHVGQESQIFNFMANPAYLTLAGWQTSGYDAHSYGTPTGVTSATALLKYNATKLPVTYPLTGTYRDITYASTGKVYVNFITLQPFTSAILYKATVDIIQGFKIGNMKFR